MEFDRVFQVLDAAIFVKAQRHLKDVEKFVLWGSWQGQTYEQMAEASNYRYTPSYLKQGVGPRLWRLISEALEEEICKTNFRTALERLVLKETLLTQGQNREAELKQYQDWGVVESQFYGRTEELATLQGWLVNNSLGETFTGLFQASCCSLVALLGVEGIGKTALAAQLVHQVSAQFEYVIWRSLKPAPLLLVLLTELLQVLSHQKVKLNLLSVEYCITQLLEHLRNSRCLIVLDNAEVLLRRGDSAGCYQEGYEGYSELFQRVGETRHQSCLVVISREKLRELAILAEKTSCVRLLKLGGLKVAQGRAIFESKGNFSGSELEWRVLIQHYGGNPLALKIVASEILFLVDGNISEVVEWLKQGAFVFDDIRNLLDRQFERLSQLEKEIMYWLALEPQPVTFQRLQVNFRDKISFSKVLENLASLERRFLIEKAPLGAKAQKTAHAVPTRTMGFTLQPMVMEYMTEKMVEQVYEAIRTENRSCKVNSSLSRLK